MARLPLLLLLCLLSACGFHLRGGVPDSLVGKSIGINGLAQSTNLYKFFSARLKAAGSKVAEKNADAIAVINFKKQRHVRRSITLNAVGRANMFNLIYVVVYQVRDNKGRSISPVREIAIQREYFNTQSSPLSQGIEEQTYRQEMETEASTVLMRQVISIIENPRPIPENKEVDEPTKSDGTPESSDKDSSDTQPEKP
jgi:LPS-assembly lipoprotein